MATLSTPAHLLIAKRIIYFLLGGEKRTAKPVGGSRNVYNACIHQSKRGNKIFFFTLTIHLLLFFPRPVVYDIATWDKSHQGQTNKAFISSVFSCAADNSLDSKHRFCFLAWKQGYELAIDPLRYHLMSVRSKCLCDWARIKWGRVLMYLCLCPWN